MRQHIYKCSNKTGENMQKLLFAAASLSLALSAGVNAQALTTTQTTEFSAVTRSVSDAVARTPTIPSQVGHSQ